MPNRSELYDLPNDVIKLIISYCPCPQWFILSKELKSIASQVISPLDYRTDELCDSFQWAIIYNKICAVTSLLKDSRIDPCAMDNWAIRKASQYGHKEIVELLLQGIEFYSRFYYNSVVSDLLR
jgi:hypothetical protein